MRRFYYRISSVITCLILIAGCAEASPKYSPEEWLSLSYAGLAAMDQYSFAGSMRLGMDEGVLLKPRMFEGKVVNHHQLTIQSNQQDPLYWNPVQVLEALNESHETVELLPPQEPGAYSAEVVTIRVKEKEEESKKRWGSALSEELEHVANDPALAGSERNAVKRKELLERADAELRDMLSTLQVETEYDIVIDKRQMLPLKMEERTTFTYERDKRTRKENRHTTVRFEAFDGTSTLPGEVHGAANRDTMKKR
ncbi:hypothetical protein [Paenibacillus soyae]|uniref:Uncharacterized protein n=1 Tax=Paenibacillus soyae TaxID=2969249 RepID=A0A9X2S993_9BACL|nr:hypothetical protein [Paenibacillus soyae]MCR2804890.1 hypothetical protein [Paenibacillus soyae]